MGNKEKPFQMEICLHRSTFKKLSCFLKFNFTCYLWEHFNFLRGLKLISKSSNNSYYDNTSVFFNDFPKKDLHLNAVEKTGKGGEDFFE